MMKFTVTAALCISLFLVDVDFSLATKTKGGGLLKIFKKPAKTKPTKSKDSILEKEKQPTQHNQGNYPQQPAGRYPQYPGQHGGNPNQGGYPQQPAGGYPQYPGRPGGYPNQGGYPQYPGYPAGSYPAQGPAYGGYGNYPGSYINYNPNNKILSPHYGGSFGYGGYGGGGGSPFSHSVGAMGYAPSSKSKGFGRSAVMAAAGGAMAGMALGYGLGRFPRPHFHFHNPQEEYYYNYYMYRKYGMKSNDKNDYSRDYQYSQPPEAFDKFMESCLKRTDLLPEENQKPKAAKITIASVNTINTSNGINASSGFNTSSGVNASSGINASSGVNASSDAIAGSFSTASTPEHLNKSEVKATTPSPTRIPRTDDEDDTVSIVEIGYPALIKQMKVKRCTELFIVYADRHLKKKTPPTVHPNSGIRGLNTGLLSVLTTTLMLMLLN